MTWPTVSLGDICEFKYGKSLPAAKRHPGEIPVFGSNGVVGRHSERLTAGPTIVIGRKGSLGEVHYSETGCWPIDTTYYIDDGAAQVDLKWLAHLLPSLALTKLNRAAAVPGLNREDAYRRTLLLPPPDEQRRVAAVLDQADELLAKRRQAVGYLSDLSQSMFLDMFGDPFANPRGWVKVPLGSLATKFSDGPFGSNLKSSHYVDSGTRVVRLQNIGTGSFVDADKAFVSDDHFSSLEKHRCLPGDILIGTLGDPNLRACVQPAWLSEALNKADCIQMRIDTARSNRDWIVALLNMPGTLKLAKSLVLGQTRARISMGRLRQLLVPVPPLSAQDEFGERMRTYHHLRDSHTKADACAVAMSTSLQARAFAGQL